VTGRKGRTPAPERFGKVPRWIVDRCHRSEDGRGFLYLMGVALAKHGRTAPGGGGEWTLSQTELRPICGRSERQIRRYVAYARRRGVLETSRPYDPQTGWLGIMTYHVLTWQEHKERIRARVAAHRARRGKSPACDQRTWTAGHPDLWVDVDAYVRSVQDEYAGLPPPDPPPRREPSPAMAAAITGARDRLPPVSCSRFLLMARAAVQALEERGPA